MLPISTQVSQECCKESVLAADTRNCFLKELQEEVMGRSRYFSLYFHEITQGVALFSWT